jgi:hypothetical protein
MHYAAEKARYRVSEGVGGVCGDRRVPILRRDHWISALPLEPCPRALIGASVRRSEFVTELLAHSEQGVLC